MNFIQRALKQVQARKAKSLLLLCTFFLIASFVVVGLGVSQAAEEAKKSTRQKMNPIIQYKVDFDKYYNDMASKSNEERSQMEAPKPDNEAITKMMQDSRVKTASWFRESLAYANQFEPVKVDRSQSEEEDNNTMASGSFIMSSSGMGNVNPNLSLHLTATDKMLEFEEGQYQLLKGRNFTPEDISNQSKVCIIDQALAEANNLGVGDTLSIDLYSKEEKEKFGLTDDEVKMELEIIGIFQNNNQLSPEMMSWAQDYMHPSNRVLMPLSSYVPMDMAISEKMYAAADEETKKYMQMPSLEGYDPSQVTLMLNDPLDVDEFKSDYAQYASDYLMLDANDSMYRKLAKPLDTMSMFANFIVWIVILNAVVILTLVSALTLKTREYEIGVLLSLGVSKFKIIGQLFIEMAAVAIIGFTLATAAGSLISKEVGKQILNLQVSQSESEDGNLSSGNFVGFNEQSWFNEVSMDEVTADYDASINLVIIMEIYALGFAVIFVSILIPSAMIMRFNPKKILLNTN